MTNLFIRNAARYVSGASAAAAVFSMAEYGVFTLGALLLIVSIAGAVLIEIFGKIERGYDAAGEVEKEC